MRQYEMAPQAGEQSVDQAEEASRQLMSSIVTSMRHAADLEFLYSEERSDTLDNLVPRPLHSPLVLLQDTPDRQQACYVVDRGPKQPVVLRAINVTHDVGRREVTPLDKMWSVGQIAPDNTIAYGDGRGSIVHPSEELPNDELRIEFAHAFGAILSEIRAAQDAGIPRGAVYAPHLGQ